MRAVVRDEYGGPDVLKIEEIDKPVDDGVLVRVRAAALNPTDYVVMRGFPRPQTGWRRPRQRVVGIDVAGPAPPTSSVRGSASSGSTGISSTPQTS